MNKLLYIFLMLASQTVLSQEVKVLNLRCEYRTDPEGIETLTPRLSWELQSSHRSVLQTAWGILVSDDTLSLLKNSGRIWDSQQRPGDSSIVISYAGPA